MQRKEELSESIESELSNTDSHRLHEAVPSTIGIMAQSNRLSQIKGHRDTIASEPKCS